MLRKTKIVCTIGPKTFRYQQIEKLAASGMNVVRLNMSHGDHAWHKRVIQAVKTINAKACYSLAILLDTKGSEVRTGDVKKEIELVPEEKVTFTIRRMPEYPDRVIEVSYDGFIDNVKKGDSIIIDGGMLQFAVEKKTKTDITCIAKVSGTLGSRRHISIEGKSTGGPSVTENDWNDIDFAIKEGVDFLALSFVKDANALHQVKKYLEEKRASIDVIAKIESAETIPKLQSIIAASDGVMIARGDLGAEIPLEDVPLVQEEIVEACRRENRPVIVATHLLESMIVNPTPTRAEITDISQAVMQGADAIMLSGETAAGEYPFAAVSVMDRVAKRIEQRVKDTAVLRADKGRDVKEEIARSAVIMANNIAARALIVFTRRGSMAALLSRCRPASEIFAFTNMSTVRRKLNLYWGVTSYRIEFSKDPEKTIQRAIEYLRKRNMLGTDETVVVVSDILAGSEFVETVQVRRIRNEDKNEERSKKNATEKMSG